jgi:hypothetical protein
MALYKEWQVSYIGESSKIILLIIPDKLYHLFQDELKHSAYHVPD